MRVLISGLPVSAKDIIYKAVSEAFGDGVVELVELTRENLRQQVRLSKRNLEVIQVILDRVSSEACKDIENGLYESDRYHTYTDDKDLVGYLNSKYSLSLELPEDEQPVSSSDEYSGSIQEVIDKYEEKLRGRNRLIENLNAQLEEYRNSYTDVTDSDSSVEISKLKGTIDSLNEDILSLRGSLLDLEKQKKELESKIQKLGESLKDSLSQKDALASKLSKADAEYKSLNGELATLRVTYSKQSGVLNAKNAEINILNTKLQTVTDLEQSLKFYKDSYSKSEERCKKLEVDIANLRVELKSKQDETDRLNSEISKQGDTDKIITSLKESLQKAVSERDKLQQEYNRVESDRDSYRDRVKDLSDSVDSLSKENEILQKKIENADNTIVQLNENMLNLKSRLSVLETSTDRNESLENLANDLSSVRKQYMQLKDSVFFKIYDTALPKRSSSVFLTRKGVKLENIRFAFAGGTESRKGAYRCLLNEFKGLGSSSKKILIVDVVSETSIDYVFEMPRVVSGLDWFNQGGSLSPYLSSTCLSSVVVLSPGIGYINDSYFLTVDWERRLSELENSGYNVVVFCGDVSNVVGRVMHESFADLAPTVVYVHGGAVGCRTIIANLRGLSNSKSSLIAYFDYNKRLSKFYDLVAATNKCRVLNTIGG